MSILKIARMGHPVLRRSAREVDVPFSAEIHTLIADMIETMEDADGAGLAAPQVHIPLRLVIFHAPRDADENDTATSPASASPTILINPVIEPIGDDKEDDWEGCLSVPGLIGLTPRYRKIRYTALAPDGASIDKTVEGFHARVVQHECDHLDGILYPQRMTNLGDLMFREEMRHYRASEDPEDGLEDESEE